MSVSSNPFRRMPTRGITTAPGTRSDLRAVRPYVDLRGAGGAIHSRVLLHYADALSSGHQVRAVFQSNPVAHTRRHILREARLPDFHADHPADLPPELRGRRWQDLCEHVEHWPDLDDDTRARAGIVLVRLGFYATFLGLTGPDEPPTAIGDAGASLLMLRANARYKRALAAGEAVPTYESLVEHASTARSRLLAALALAVHHARVSRDSAQVDAWATRSMDLLPQALDGGEDDALLHSAVLRACSFAPFFDGDKARTTRLLDECEALARSAPADTAERALAKAENLRAVLETRAREAQWRGEADLALDRTRELVDLDADDGRAHRDLGYLLLARQDVEAALRSFARSAALGPPFAAVSWALVARCRELLDDPRAAIEAYLVACELDPGSLTALDGVARCAASIGDAGLRGWALSRSAALPALPAPADREKETVR
ncbi:tetratricopeptide repeat protein [Actinosynnema sp. NPDC049800]